MNLPQMRQKLLAYPITALSKKYEFNQRLDAKTTLLNFIGGFFLSLTYGHSLRRWASQISNFLPGAARISKAGLQKRLGPRQLACAKGFLEEVMKARLKGLETKALSNDWFRCFGKVLLEDSVCVSLNAALFETFKGSHNNQENGKTATARIQLCMNLKGLTYERFELMSYRDNDQKYSKEILDLLSPGDLVIRDLGYAVLKVFKRISGMGAYFLSRYKPGITLYDRASGQRLDLAQHLDSIARRGGNFLDQEVLVGAKERIPMRMVALQCPEEVAQERIRKARKNRHTRANHSEQYYELLKWRIFLTNVPQQTWKPQQILQIYGFRWHIEMIFKVWKSKFGLQRLMTQSQLKKALHAQIFFYLFLAYLAIFYVCYFNFFLQRIYQAHRKILSPFAFADFLKANFLPLIEAQLMGQLDDFTDQLAAAYCYEKRKGRPNQLELIFQLREAPCFVPRYPRP